MAEASLPPPADSYLFDNFIADISKGITAKELKELKQRFKGIVDHTAQTAVDMFNSMKEKGHINRFNIIYIQQILRVLGREDLLEIASRYVNLFEEDTVLHFFKSTTEPAPGFSFVRFHVKGWRILNEDLKTLQRRISTILLVQEHEVIFNGVQETNSLLITVMIPNMYVNFLRNQLAKNTQHIIESFWQLEVDHIMISTDIFNLQKKGSVYIAENTSDSSQKAHSSSKAMTTKQVDEQKYTGVHTHYKKTSKRTMPEEETKNTIVTRSHGYSESKIRKPEVPIYCCT